MYLAYPWATGLTPPSTLRSYGYQARKRVDRWKWISKTLWFRFRNTCWLACESHNGNSAIHGTWNPLCISRAMQTVTHRHIFTRGTHIHVGFWRTTVQRGYQCWLLLQLLIAEARRHGILQVPSTHASPIQGWKNSSELHGSFDFDAHGESWIAYPRC